MFVFMVKILKKQIEIAKELAKEEVSKALLSFGVTKLEGMKVLEW